jgi:DNA-binding MarR family transcriptional regulator
MHLTSEKENSIQSAFTEILKCQHSLSYQISQKLKPFDITRQQYEVLNILNDHYPNSLNMNTVRDKMHETMPDISRIAHRMYEKGYINRVKQAFDKRNTEIQLTKVGKSLIEQANPVIQEEMESYFQNLTIEDIDTLHSIINKLGLNNRE